MLNIKCVPLTLIWLKSWSHAIKRMIEENSWKNRSDWYHVRKIGWLDWLKTAKHFWVNSRRKFLSSHEASREQASGFLPSGRYLPFFTIFGSYFSNICCTFHLGQMIIRFVSISFYFYWSLALQLLRITVRLSDDMFLFPLTIDYSCFTGFT